MERASPVDLRKGLNAAQVLANAGIGFVCVPYSSTEEQVRLQDQAHKALTNMENLAAKEDKK